MNFIIEKNKSNAILTSNNQLSNITMSYKS